MDIFYLVKPKSTTPYFLKQMFTVLIKTTPVFTKNFFQELVTFSAKDLIISGDCNSILSNTLDKIGRPKHKNAKARINVISPMNILKLTGVFHLKHPLTKSFTRIQINLFAATRFDFFSSIRTFMQ